MKKSYLSKIISAIIVMVIVYFIIQELGGISFIQELMNKMNPRPVTGISIDNGSTIII